MRLVSGLHDGQIEQTVEDPKITSTNIAPEQQSRSATALEITCDRVLTYSRPAGVAILSSRRALSSVIRAA